MEIWEERVLSVFVVHHKLTMVDNKIRKKSLLQFGFVSNMFDIHESIVADFWSMHITVNNFDGSISKMIKIKTKVIESKIKLVQL